jgi:TonB family protein
MRHESLVVITLLATSAAAQEASPPPAPLRPGLIALQLARPGPDAAAAVAAGLADPRPAVRAAAARTALMLDQRDAALAVGRALATETDLDAAVEEVYALALLGGPEADAPLLEAAARLKPALAPHVADALARARRGAALLLIPKLRPLGLGSVDTMTRIATAGRTDALVPPAAVAVGAADDTTWRTLLQAAADARYAMPEGLLIASTTSSSPAVRQATYEYLAEMAAASPPSEALRAALQAAPDKALADSAGGELSRAEGVRAGLQEQPEPAERAASSAAFAWELASRGAGAEARPRETLVRLFRAPVGDTTRRPSAVESLRAFVARPALKRLLAPPEESAIRQALDNEGWSPEPPAEGAMGALKTAAAEATGIRLASGFPAGFAGDVIAASGCDSRDGAAAAEVHYRPDGRPQSVSLLTAPPGSGCRDAAAALLASALAPSWRLPGAAPEALILKFDKEYLGCQDEAEHRAGADPAGITARPRRVQQAIKGPTKTRNVPPVYPEAAKRDRVQGVVLLDATISRSGCVREVRVLRGHAMLSAAAVSAVAGWRYTPTLLDGVAVPVIMTVTVNFRLQ